MTGVVREHRRHAAGHAFHGHQIGAALAAVGENGGVHLVEDRSQVRVRNLAQVDEGGRRDAVGGGPGADALPTIVADFRRAVDVAAEAERLRRRRPSVVPQGHQKRVRATPAEDLEGGEHDILALAVFQLAAREDDETVGEQALTLGRGTKVRGIDALQDDLDVAETCILEHRAVPRRAGDDRIEPGGPGKSLSVEQGDFHKHHPDVALSLDGGAGLRKDQVVAQVVQDHGVRDDSQLSRILRRLGFDAGLFLDQGLQEVPLQGGERLDIGWREQQRRRLTSARQLLH